MEDVNKILEEKLSRLEWLLHRQQILSFTQAGPLADTSRGQGRILATLKLQDGINTKELAYILGMRVSSINELLSKLEKNGYILRVPEESDRRILNIKLTEKGRNEKQESPGRFSDIFDCLNDAEKRSFEDFIDRLSAEIENKFDSDEFKSMMKARERFAERMGLDMNGKNFRRMFGGMGLFGNLAEIRGEAPKDIPGAERFDPDYDGPMPTGRHFGRGFFGAACKERRCEDNKTEQER